MKNVRFAAVLSLLTGCSLINSLDSVKPPVDDAGSGAKGSGGKGAGGMDSGTGGVGAGGKAGGGTSAGGAESGGMGGEPPDASGDGGAAGKGNGGRGTGGRVVVETDGGDGGPPFVPGGPGGAIVVYDTGGKKLHVLDPKNGHALSSETSVRVLAIANDPITDNWYIFQQPGKVTDPVFLQVRQLNTTSGAWKNLGKAVTVPAPSLPSVGVLNKRIAYLSVPDAAGSDPTIAALSVLDTSKPDAVTVNTKNKDIGVPGQRIALLTIPDGAGVGGNGTIAIQAPCAPDCDVGLLRLLVNNTTVSLPESTPTSIGKVNSQGGSIGFAVDYQAKLDVLISPPVTNPSTVTSCNAAVPTGVLGHAAEYGVATHAVQVGPFDFDMANLRVNSAAFDSCHKIAFATSLLGDTAIWSIPMVAGKPEKLCKDGGGAMFFEAYTHGLIRVPISGDRIEAYDIDDKVATEPKLGNRPMSLPAGFATSGVLAVRQPLSGCL